jgi:hypothetical protein
MGEIRVSDVVGNLDVRALTFGVFGFGFWVLGFGVGGGYELQHSLDVEDLLWRRRIRSWLTLQRSTILEDCYWSCNGALHRSIQLDSVDEGDQGDPKNDLLRMTSSSTEGDKPLLLSTVRSFTEATETCFTGR